MARKHLYTTDFVRLRRRRGPPPLSPPNLRPTWSPLVILACRHSSLLRQSLPSAPVGCIRTDDKGSRFYEECIAVFHCLAATSARVSVNGNDHHQPQAHQDVGSHMQMITTTSFALKPPLHARFLRRSKSTPGFMTTFSGCPLAGV